MKRRNFSALAMEFCPQKSLKLHGWGMSHIF